MKDGVCSKIHGLVNLLRTRDVDWSVGVQPLKPHRVLYRLKVRVRRILLVLKFERGRRQKERSNTVRHTKDVPNGPVISIRQTLLLRIVIEPQESSMYSENSIIKGIAPYGR